MSSYGAVGILSPTTRSDKAWALGRGATHLRISGLPNNEIALAFYGKGGFAPFVHEMEKRLGA